MNHPPFVVFPIENSRMSDIKKRIIQFLGDNITEEAIAAAQDNIPFLKQSELLGGKAYNRAIASYLFFLLQGIHPEEKAKSSPKEKKQNPKTKEKQAYSSIHFGILNQLKIEFFTQQGWNPEQARPHVREVHHPYLHHPDERGHRLLLQEHHALYCLVPC